MKHSPSWDKCAQKCTRNLSNRNESIRHNIRGVKHISVWSSRATNLINTAQWRTSRKHCPAINSDLIELAELSGNDFTMPACAQCPIRAACQKKNQSLQSLVGLRSLSVWRERFVYLFIYLRENERVRNRPLINFPSWRAPPPGGTRP